MTRALGFTALAIIAVALAAPLLTDPHVDYALAVVVFIVLAPGAWLW